MKKIAILVSVLVMIGCSDEFLERTPITYYTPENFFENERQITEAVNGLYPIIKGFYTGPNWVLGELRSDNTTFQYNPSDRGAEAFESLDYFLADAGNGTFSNLWNSAYNGIARANFVLESIDGASFSSEEMRELRRGEAHFVRAFCYYFLVTYFGDVPYVDKVQFDAIEAGDLRREDENLIISDIVIPDLQSAIEKLPIRWDKNNEGRGSKAAALMLKSRIHFYQRDFNAAIPELESIIQSGEFALNTNYSDAFSPDTKVQNSEIIFAIQFAPAFNQGAGFFYNWLPNNSGVDLSGEGGFFVGALNGKNIPTKDMIASYEEGDRRFDASVGLYIYEAEEGEIPDTAAYIRKYFFPPLLPGGSEINLPVFRYAETILMWAEAKTNVEGVTEEVQIALNNLRVRAGLGLIFPGNPNPDLDVSSKEKLLEIIRRERRVELAFEGQRFSDLVRYDILQEKMLSHGEEQIACQDFLQELSGAYLNITDKVAIPQQEVLIYEYQQNPGW